MNREAGFRRAHDPRQACWRVAINGSFRLIDDITRKDCTPRSRKACALIAYLASRAGERVARERLASLLWGDRASAQAKASLRQALLEIRQATGGAFALVDGDRHHVWIDDRRVLLDDPALENEGQFFEDLDHLSPDFDDWLQLERARLERVLVDFHVEQVDDALARGRGSELIDLIAKLQQCDPLNEDVLRLRLRAEYQAGHTAGIIAAYRDYAQLVERDLGVRPSDATLDLRNDLLDRLTRAQPAPQETGRGDAEAPVAPLPVPPSASSASAGEELASAPTAAPPRLPRPRSWRFGRWRTSAVAALCVAAVAAVAVGPGLLAEADGRDIAVMPFAADGVGAPVADGFTQDLQLQLSRNDRLRVLGRSAALFDGSGHPNLMAMRDSLGVDYVLEGRVADRDGALSVQAALVRTRDGRTIWADRFGSDAATQISQGAIVSAVANALGVSGSGGSVQDIPPDASRLYFEALSLIRQRGDEQVDTARQFLAQLVRDHPDFAPGWAQLGTAIALQVPRALTKEERLAEVAAADEALHRALRLSPNLAEAHAAMSLVKQFGSREGRWHAARAVQENPRSAQNLYWFALNEYAAGNYDRANRSLFASAAIDPRWNRPILVIAQMKGEEGRLADALAWAARLERDGAGEALGARMAARSGYGDLSEVIREGMANPPRTMSEAVARRTFFETLVALGYGDQAGRLEGLSPDWAAIIAQRPPPLDRLLVAGEGKGETAHQLLDSQLAWSLTAADRPGDLVAYAGQSDGPLSAILNGETVEAAQLVQLGMPLAVALGTSGRTADAARLWAQIDAAARQLSRNAALPAETSVGLAAFELRAGRRAQALALLRRALDRRYVSATGIAHGTLGRDPRFAALRGNPAFERLAATSERRWQAERDEARAFV